jgi:quinol-cytochrome oxidoreductase complex cytochrome b subunit
MAPTTTPPAPGSMTVPPLFGWEVILVVLVVLVVVAVAFVAFGAMRAGRTDRSEWQAWLDTRSASYRRSTADEEEPTP